MGLLDLSGADTSGFEAIPAGTYPAEIHEVAMKETKGGENAKLPAGTPYINVQYRITDPEYDNRRVFGKYIIAPAKVDGKKYEAKAKMDGMLARFFIALGYEEDEVTSGTFEPDLEDLVGRACKVTVKQRDYQGEMQNDVTGVRPLSDDEAAAPAGSGLL